MSEPSIRLAVDVALDPERAFAAVAEELVAALAAAGTRLEPRPGGGVDNGTDRGRVVLWEPGSKLAIEWHAPDWLPQGATRLDVAFEPTPDGTCITLEHSGWGGFVGAEGELVGWLAGNVVAPLWRATAPERFSDWLTDRAARRPMGAQARATYGEPIYHYPSFRVILTELALGAGDHFLEVGCGGGALLREALKSGCRAAAIDHSPDMVRLARQTNQAAVEEGRLEIQEGKADSLPFADATFSCAAMTGVLGFLPDPVAALAEIRRVLQPGGRMIVQGTDPELRGTPAAPEPMASRLRFYDSQELEAVGRQAGFETLRVERRSMAAFAREAGVPDEHLELFSGPGARFLLARKD